MLLVIIGVAAAAILAVFPKAVTGRVELRKRISRTIHDLSKLYGILVGDILATKGTDAEPTPGQRKAFRKLALGIRRQIADEQTYLKITKLEPPLRGKFPVEEYTKLVEKVDNMADLLQGMAFASRSIDKAWKRKLVRVIEEERMEYASLTCCGCIDAFWRFYFFLACFHFIHHETFIRYTGFQDGIAAIYALAHWIATSSCSQNESSHHPVPWKLGQRYVSQLLRLCCQLV